MAKSTGRGLNTGSLNAKLPELIICNGGDG
jgi:hypothetical protein